MFIEVFVQETCIPEMRMATQPRCLADYVFSKSFLRLTEHLILSFSRRTKLYYKSSLLCLKDYGAPREWGEALLE